MSKADNPLTSKRRLPPMAAGQRYGNLVVIEPIARGSHSRWKFLCDCGREHEALATHVRGGHIQSCGCMKGKLISQKKITHGMNESAEYKSWGEMRQRCLNSNNHKFPDYGGRGICICERWNKFENFYADMGAKPSPQHTIERIDNDRCYEPQNCIWGTKTQQARNRRSSRMLTYQGRTMTLAEAAELTGLNYWMIKTRLNLGWSVERALAQESRVKNRRQK